MRAENEFIWVNFGEPHAERRRRIFEKYGKEIKKLMVIEWKTKWIVLAVVTLQMTFSYTVPHYFLGEFLATQEWYTGIPYEEGDVFTASYDTHTFTTGSIYNDSEFPVLNNSSYSFSSDEFSSPTTKFSTSPWYTTWLPCFLIAWAIGGTLSQNMFLGIHEISHNTAFRNPFLNDLLAIVLNFPIAIPFAMVFKTYHQEHHRYLGWEGVDTDLPEHLEAWLLRSFPGKVFFLMLQTLFYSLRPMMVRQPPLTTIHYLNWGIMIVWWLLQYAIFGGPRFIVSWLYLFASTLCTSFFHPTSGHFISEHYVFNLDTFQETFSYYGWGNLIGWNVGYHNEHHDFPSIPWSLLPKVKEIAPEFYEPLEHTTSWTKTLWDFLTDPNVSQFSRVKRERGAGRRKGKLLPTTPPDNYTPAADPVSMMQHLDALAREHPVLGKINAE